MNGARVAIATVVGPQDLRRKVALGLILIIVRRKRAVPAVPTELMGKGRRTCGERFKVLGIRCVARLSLRRSSLCGTSSFPRNPFASLLVAAEEDVELPALTLYLRIDGKHFCWTLLFGLWRNVMLTNRRGADCFQGQAWLSYRLIW